MAEVEIFGESFRLVDEPSEFAWMEFADAAESIDSNTMPAMAAVYRLLQDAITADDWPRFRAAARKNRATTETMMPVIFAVGQAVTDRPTGQPSDSSVGLAATPPKSVSTHEVAATELFPGRPDTQTAWLRSIPRSA